MLLQTQGQPCETHGHTFTTTIRNCAKLLVSVVSQRYFVKFCQTSGCRQMHYSDQQREQAAHYRQLAENAADSADKVELLELAAICEEVANKIDDRRASG
jgi:hypothetical protein